MAKRVLGAGQEVDLPFEIFDRLAMATLKSMEVAGADVPPGNREPLAA